MTAQVDSLPSSPPPTRMAESDPRDWTVLAVMCLALLIVEIDGTIVNVALPTLVREIGASNTELQWVVDATPTTRCSMPSSPASSSVTT